ncbi:C40 family peptidase [Micromonospora sp. HM5-17]|jgi:cell wall-associated NlpC family hydrolase|uniref:C40 family peptidase n=1 Tax=Micromonospora sp. HM5-17 TaxID=2487710 RepID=UPI000F4A92BA|nr:C40 family peptidase [Micromonospora sp. HM5-17]ROT33900.1 NlpC/P60 family protein [Micromonospora sp. HM5-17]
MANSGRGQAERTDGTVSPVLRPLVWSALVGAIVAGVLATPVWAEPATPNTVPDPGVRPVPAGAPPSPGSSPSVPPNLQIPTVTGPLASQIYALEVEVATLGEELLKLRQTRDEKAAAVTAANTALATARAELEQARAIADSAAAEALKDAAGLPPGAFGSDLHGLELLKRIQRGEERSPRDTSLAAAEVNRALAAQQQAEAAYQKAVAESQQAAAAFTEAEKKYKERSAALLKLKRENAEKLAEIEREREAAEQRIGNEIGLDSVNGLVANPKALGAVKYALAQRGDPYQWGAEGPDRFDCSGLVWAAYRSQGKTLPRVSRDQYNGTRSQTVAREALLPGDLLFFASGSSWTSIHHVGMYIGDGKMVHAPTTGDVVKVSTVWWSRFYAATRVFPAVPAPTTSPTTRPPTTPSPRPTPSKTTKPPTTTPPTTKPPTSMPTVTPTTPTTIPTPPTTAPTTEPTTTPTGGSSSNAPSATGSTPTAGGSPSDD